VGETNGDFEARELLKALGRKLSAGFMFSWIGVALVGIGLTIHSHLCGSRKNRIMLVLARFIAPT
jgi:hypothetical protein